MLSVQFTHDLKKRPSIFWAKKQRKADRRILIRAICNLMLGSQRFRRREFRSRRRQWCFRNPRLSSTVRKRVVVAHSIDDSVDVVLSRNILLLRRRGAFILSRRVTLVHGENPLLPPLFRTQAINTVLTDLVIDVSDLTSNMSKKFEVFGQRFNPLEPGNKVQDNKSLRVHMLSEEQVLAQIIHREIVFTAQFVRFHGTLKCQAKMR